MTTALIEFPVEDAAIRVMLPVKLISGELRVKDAERFSRRAL